MLHLSHNMYFGDSFNEAAILDEFNPFMGPARTGWFVQANCKCVLFEIKKADMIKLLPPFIKVRASLSRLVLGPSPLSALWPPREPAQGSCSISSLEFGFCFVCIRCWFTSLIC